MRINLMGKATPASAAALIVVLACALTLQAQRPAEADNFGAWGGIYYTNNYYQEHTYFSLTNTYASAANWFRDNATTHSVMTLSYTSNTNYTEVRQYDGYYGSNYPIAATGCYYGPSSSGVCSVHMIKYNLSKPRDSTYNYQHVACHEMGHAVGLHHTSSTTSCLGPTYRIWGDHDKLELANHY